MYKRQDLRREMREHTVALPGTRRRMSLNAQERGGDADRPTTRLPHLGKHLGAHLKNRDDSAPRGKHSKGGEA